jgi:hypothetical protein
MSDQAVTVHGGHGKGDRAKTPNQFIRVAQGRLYGGKALWTYEFVLPQIHVLNP